MEKMENGDEVNMSNLVETQHISHEDHGNHENKKRKSEEEGEKHDVGENEDHEGENSEAKKSKKDLTYGGYQSHSPEDMVSLEALATGSVPDMATAYSIASLSGQPPQNTWNFMNGATGNANENGGDQNATQLAQQASMYQQFLFQQQAWYLQNMQREMQHQINRDDSGTGLFVLLEHPNEVQRKSYKNENRCLLPNPLTVCMREMPSDEKKTQILDGTVSVSLVDADGEELPIHKQNILESIERSLTQHLDENFTAQFSLKVLETSEGNQLRLLFTVQYRMKGVGNCEEKILSRAFIVSSNRKKHMKSMGEDGLAERERPIPTDIKPPRGEALREQEVWIKGRCFSDKVSVMFGEKPAKVLDNSENLITVIPPQRDDVIDQEVTVHVVVSNKFARELFTAEKKLTYTYYPKAL